MTRVKAIRSARITVMLVALASVVGCTTGNFERYTFSRVRMGSQAKLVIWTNQPRPQVEAAADAAFVRIAEIEADTSDWLVDGPVAALQKAKPGERVSLPVDLAAVLRASGSIVTLTNGAFDPACGRLTKLWRAARANGVPPSQGEINAAAAGSGWDRLHFDAQSGTIMPEAPVPWLDFGGIGKGFAAEEALAVLDAHGLPHSMVDMGGDLALGERPPEKDGWSVALPNRGHVNVQGRSGWATSGSSEQHLDVGERRLSHVIDPRTGAAVEDRAAYTVQAPSAAMADALASAACVLGAEALEQLLEPMRPHVSILRSN